MKEPILKWHDKLMLFIALIFFGMLIVVAQPEEELLKVECVNVNQGEE